jgi:hypothetical protein
MNAAPFDLNRKRSAPSIFAESRRVQRVRRVPSRQMILMLRVSCYRLDIRAEIGVGYGGYADI